MWRVAHVTNQTQADEFDAKLKSLEAVVAAFDLNTPELDGDSEPADPQPRGQHSQPAPQSTAGIMLED